MSTVTLAGAERSVNLTIMPLLTDGGGKRHRLDADVRGHQQREADDVDDVALHGPGASPTSCSTARRTEMLGGLSTEATVMFTDIRGFTPITEELGAQGTVVVPQRVFQPDGRVHRQRRRHARQVHRRRDHGLLRPADRRTTTIPTARCARRSR